MSIIERAAGKILPDAPPPPTPPVSPAKEEARPNLIQASIDRAEASFATQSTPAIAVQQQQFPRPTSASSFATPDGPPSVLSQPGQVDMARLRAAGALTPDAGRTRIAEEYRLIKRPLLANAFGQGETPPLRNGNIIMVTSSVPGEGKSFTAINLAISMATEMENTVLLVDADVTKAAVMKYLGLSADRGLIDVLLNPETPLSEVLIRTNIAKLTVLPSGRGIAHATELLASNAMQAFVNDIASRYPDRIVIFDTPPLLSTSEASVLASYMGQVVFVVEAERTPQEAVREALSHLKNTGYVGMILNKAPQRSGAGDYYGYGYGGYGYGSYGESSKN